MKPEFQRFIDKWRAIASSGDAFRLPARGEITIAAFHEFLPSMMIAAWDMETNTSQVLYAGTKIDAAFQRDIRHSPMKAMFASEEHVAAHVDIAMTVIKEQVAAEVHADLLIDGGQTVTLSQLRLPLAPEDGKPLIVSMFLTPDLTEPSDVAELPVVKNFRNHYIEILPVQARSA